jgi:hypothetical protein
MVVVRSLVASCAVLVAIAPSGCRGEAERTASAPAPADQPLAWPALDEPGLIGLVASGDYQLGAPVPLAIAPDGAVLYRRSKPRDPSADLYQLDPAGNTTLLASASALLGDAAVPEALRDDAALGIQRIELSEDGARVLVPLAGRAFAIERATAIARELVIGPHGDPALSPDGTRVAFARDGDLWVAEIPAARPDPASRPAPGPNTASPGRATPVVIAPVRLAQHPPDREYATPELVARDLGRERGLWWSPDSRSIAFQRSDLRAVDSRVTADPRHPERAAVAIKFPRAGTPNAVVDLGVVALRGGAPRWVSWDLARYPYLARVIWPATGPLTAVVMNREQTQIAALAADLANPPGGPATGATRPLVVDQDPAWINLAADPLIWLPDGSGFLWMTERGGAWSLERYARDGAHAGAVVTPDLGLRRVVGLSSDGRDAIIEATTDPREQHVWRVSLAGGAPVALTAATAPAATAPTATAPAATAPAATAPAATAPAATAPAATAPAATAPAATAPAATATAATAPAAKATATAAPAATPGGGIHRAWAGHGVVVIASSQRSGGRITQVVRSGAAPIELPSLAERPKLGPTTRIESLTLDDHIQYAAITRPHRFEPNVRYPVLLRVDGEPTRNAVVDALDAYAVDQWYADAGFIVVRSDGRGTPGRDRLWQRKIAGDVLTIAMNDQIGALQQLGARFPELDLRRVGAIGSGFGGYLAALGAMIHPDAFAAAVAVSPITDWAQVETSYAERYLKTPAANPEGYRRVNAASYAEQLARPLLIVSSLQPSPVLGTELGPVLGAGFERGTTGDRSGSGDAAALIDALSAAGKRVEFATLPAHPDLAARLARTKLALDFLRQQLGPPVHPAVMPTPRTEEEREEEEER